MSDLVCASFEEIRRFARGSLVAADALERTPAPLEDIAAAAGLLPAEALFEMGAEVPPGLVSIIRKLAGKVAGGLALRERTVYLDFSQPYPRRRWTHGHEVGHKVLPWHAAAYFGDDQHTLRPDTRDALEQEANAFAAEVLFGLDRFTEQADSFAPGIAVPLSLNPEYAVSAHAGLRRYADRSRHQIALLVLGRHVVRPGGQPALKVIANQCAQSEGFLQRYGPITAVTPQCLGLSAYPAAALAAQLDMGVADDTSEITLETRRGAERFGAEAFSNGRLRFLLLHRRAIFAGRRLRGIAA